MGIPHTVEKAGHCTHMFNMNLCVPKIGESLTREMLIAVLICPVLHVAIFTLAIIAQMRTWASIGIGLGANGYYLK